MPHSRALLMVWRTAFPSTSSDPHIKRSLPLRTWWTLTLHLQHRGPLNRRLLSSTASSQQASCVLNEAALATPGVHCGLRPQGYNGRDGAVAQLRCLLERFTARPSWHALRAPPASSGVVPCATDLRGYLRHARQWHQLLRSHAPPTTVSSHCITSKLTWGGPSTFTAGASRPMLGSASSSTMALMRSIVTRQFPHLRAASSGRAPQAHMGHGVHGLGLGQPRCRWLHTVKDERARGSSGSAADLAMYGVALAIGMVGVTYAAVPLYRIVCVVGFSVW
jgi:hypothetical protein